VKDLKASLAHTRGIGGRGDLRRGKWIGGERFGGRRGDCASEDVLAYKV
jgi:hypothetical protein